MIKQVNIVCVVQL